jgi:hypothetical protein
MGVVITFVIFIYGLKMALTLDENIQGFRTSV